MLAKCANPVCKTPFLYLREGRLFQIEMGAEAPRTGQGQQNAEESKSTRRLEFFWLCGGCAPRMTLAFDRVRGVITVPLPTQRAAAS